MKNVLEARSVAKDTQKKTKALRVARRIRNKRRTTSEAADDGEERKNQPASWKSKLSPLNSYRLLFLLQKQKPV